MRLPTTLVPITALALVLGSAGWSAEAAQRERRGGRQGAGQDGQESGRDGQGQTRERAGARRERDSGSPGPAADNGARVRRRDSDRPVAALPTPDRSARDADARPRAGDAAEPPRGGPSRVVPGDRRAGGRVDNRADNRDGRRLYGGADGRGNRGAGRSGARRDRDDDDRRASFYYRDDYYRYSPPRIISPRRVAPRRYYGPGGYGSAYFGWGSGYRFGSPYSGRVYGYLAPSLAYGTYRYFGDVRLLVRPRHAQVYVDGYYAGIVDDFDGVFQRLTLEAGPHEIEIAAPGFESQFFDVYVDPTRTVDLYGDLYPDRR
jgi:PEGA domain